MAADGRLASASSAQAVRKGEARVLENLQLQVTALWWALLWRCCTNEIGMTFALVSIMLGWKQFKSKTWGV
jgi:hypothetical protein